MWFNYSDESLIIVFGELILEANINLLILQEKKTRKSRFLTGVKQDIVIFEVSLLDIDGKGCC